MCSLESADVPTVEVQPYDAASDGHSRDENDGYLTTPWRDTKLSWDSAEYDKLRARIASHNTLVTQTKNYNILLTGQIGSGKSSLVNTFFSAMRNDLGQLAFNAESDKSTTTKLRSYRLRESVKQRAVNVTMWDTMGFEGSYGPTLRDMEYLLDGHIKDGYTFKPTESISFKDRLYNTSPEQDDRMHVVVMVVDALPMSTMDVDIMDKLKGIMRKANEKDIRVCVVMTKVDNACELVYNDVSTVFHSAQIENCAGVIHEVFGCIMANILPMQNYASKENISLPLNILALHTLENILRLADNTMEATPGASMQADVAEEPAAALLEKPWRSNCPLTEEHSAKLCTDLLASKPKRIEMLNLCLLGPVGAGKSSFVNSVITTLYGRVMTTAETGRLGTPVTSHYREYTLRQGRQGEELHVKLLDTMGLMSHYGGILTEDITTVLDGKVDNTTAFNPRSPMLSAGKPISLKTRVHALVLVVNAQNFANYDKGMKEKMKLAMGVAKCQPREIPRVVLVTHMDALCPHVHQDPATMFHSATVRDVIHVVHETLQVPLVDIWPVCNYADDVMVNQPKSALVLLALHRIVEQAQDYIADAPIENWERPQGFLKRLMSWFGW